MLAALNALRGEHEFEVEVRDVDADPAWVERYDELVPVLLLGDEELCHYFLDMAKVREVLGRFR
jgi:thioredoxin reductase (NADPH)